MQLTNEIRAESTRVGGVCLGGIIFEFADEWWKAGNPSQQDAGGLAPGGGPHPDGVFNEEYWGLVTVNRTKRAAFHAYKNLTLPVEACPARTACSATAAGAYSCAARIAYLQTSGGGSLTVDAANSQVGLEYTICHGCWNVTR